MKMKRKYKLMFATALLIGVFAFVGCSNQNTNQQNETVDVEEENVKLSEEEALEEIEDNLREYAKNLQFNVEDHQILAIMDFEEVAETQKAKVVAENPKSEDKDLMFFWDGIKMLMDMEASASVRLMKDNGFDDYTSTIIIYKGEDSMYMTTEAGVLSDSITE